MNVFHVEAQRGHSRFEFYREAEEPLQFLVRFYVGNSDTGREERGKVLADASDVKVIGRNPDNVDYLVIHLCLSAEQLPQALQHKAEMAYNPDTGIGWYRKFLIDDGICP